MKFQTLLNIFLVLALVGVVVFWRVERSEFIQAKEAEYRSRLKELKVSMDSLNFARGELVAEKLLAIKEMQKSTQEANMKLQKAEKLIHEYKNLKPVVSRDDAHRDSLLFSVLN